MLKEWGTTVKTVIQELFKAYDRSKRPTLMAGMGPIAHEKGTTFRVWAPNAQAVYVTGDFHDWQEDTNLMKHEADGYWSIDVAGDVPGQEYKYIIVNGEQRLYRPDPYSRQVTSSVGNSLIHDLEFDWGEAEAFQSPSWYELVIYEMQVSAFNPM